MGARGWATTSGGSGCDFWECGPRKRSKCACTWEQEREASSGQEEAFVQISQLQKGRLIRKDDPREKNVPLLAER